MNFVRFAYKFFVDNPEVFQYFCKTKDESERLKIFNQICVDYQKSEFYNSKKPADDAAALHIISNNVYHNLENTLKNPDYKDFITNYIKIIKTEYLES
jgi:hypothetical protein